MVLRIEEDDPKEEIEFYQIYQQIRMMPRWVIQMSKRYVSTYTLRRTLLHIDVK